MSVRIFVNGYWVQLPLNNVELSGSLNYEIEDITSTATLTSSSNFIVADAASAAITVNLPAAATAKAGRAYSIKKSDSSDNYVTIDGNDSETIDGDLTFDLTMEDESVTVICDGTNWHII